ncbi:WD repeat-containing protein 41 [Oryzias melastigma]|uniref:WD repeat-containing protein 41 n=1 Tax=Oryzias melastigma TaxID=30732 RepID=A0A834C2F8_ORYME|nr:WD repeat-containing protein 41 [Oryzias melastigma]
MVRAQELQPLTPPSPCKESRCTCSPLASAQIGIYVCGGRRHAWPPPVITPSSGSCPRCSRVRSRGAKARKFPPDCFWSPRMHPVVPSHPLVWGEGGSGGVFLEADAPHACSRCASAGDDGLVLVWNIETGERLQELRGHAQQITAIIAFTCEASAHTALITASSDRSVSVSSTTAKLSGYRNFLLSLSQPSAVGSRLRKPSPDGVRPAVLSEGVTALIELPKNHLAAAVDREIVIYRLTLSEDSDVSLTKIRCLSDHRDQIRALINVNDRLFASGSHAGELILWDAVDWNNLKYEHILWEESQPGAQSEIRMKAPRPSEMSIQHLTTNGQLILAAVGSGLYVYDLQSKSVAAYRKAAHDSNVLHTLLLSDSELMSCSEDGSVRIWEIQDLPLPAEPASAGFFGTWTFSRSHKQSAPQSKKVTDFPNTRKLELIGDLIGHSGAVQMFVSFGEDGLVTCSADHLLILWKDGERQSRLRSQALFQKLEENGGL